MLSITKDTLIKVKTSLLRNIPRDIYIAGSIDLVKEVFQNAYIIPHVKWYKLSSFYKEFTGDDLENHSGSYRKIRDAKKNIKSAVDGYSEEFKDVYTVIPFTPSKDYTKGVTDWKVPSSNLMSKNASLFRGYYSYYHNDSREFMKLLMENANAMIVMLRGVVYESPCEFCASIYNRISGECELFNTDEYNNQTCQPRLAFGAHMFMGDEEGEASEVDYSKALLQNIWEKNDETMEV